MRVMVRRKSAMRPYAAIVGTPPADTSDVNATVLGRIVHRMTAPKTYITVTALRGWPLASTRPIQWDIGRTPSRATAKIKREAATTAILVFYNIVSNEPVMGGQKHTRMRPMTARIVIKMLGPLPRAMAYSWTNG